MKAKKQLGQDESEDALVSNNNPRHERTDTDIPIVGDWFYVKDGDADDEDEADEPRGWLGCVVSIGSNYFEVRSVSGGNRRVHSDKFWTWCKRAHDAEETIKAAIAEHRANVAKLMTEIQAVTARLHIGPKQSLKGGAEDETRALSVQNGMGPIGKYKKDLIKAKEKTLPELFQKIEAETETMAKWMKAALIPLKAEAENTKAVLEVMEDRIFSVELYAGLVEEMVLIKEGKPGHVDEKLHLFQRRCYMDEECLAAYETGGMDIKSLKSFENWLCRPANLNRILPFQRCMAAFRVRRDTKEREVFDLRSCLKVLAEMQTDKYTFLYIRNGQQVYRMRTGIEFDEQLFPDIDHRISNNQKLWARTFGGSFSGGHEDSLISDGEYQEMLKEEAEHDAKVAAAPEKERWHMSRHYPDSSYYVAYTPDSVFYDDVSKYLASQIKKHNRIVLILQGILDRSPAVHPHPPWQLWTPEGFAAALVLHHDDSRALSDGDRPDFEAYRARLNASLKVGSVTVGQEDAWERAEAERENARRRRSWRNNGREYYPTHYRPYGNPGPGTLAKVEKRHRNGDCTYTWTRQRQRQSWKDNDPRCHLTVPCEKLLNVDAYKPGDFHIFFDDPRTRAEYLKWAPMLLEAEEYHAGNRKVGGSKRGSRVGGEERGNADEDEDGD